MRGLILALFLFIPLSAGAQEDPRAQIRAQLMQDPQTANLPPAEFELLVEALAGEAESSPEGIMYMDAQTAPAFFYDDAPVAAPSPILAMLSTPIVIAVLALAAGILGFILFAIRHRHKVPDLQNSQS